MVLLAFFALAGIARKNSSATDLSKHISIARQEPVIPQPTDLYSRLSSDTRQILVWAVSNGWTETRENDIGRTTISKEGSSNTFYCDDDVRYWGQRNGYLQHSNESIDAKKSYDVTKWTALLKYDDDLKAVADKFANFGQKFSDEFAADYLTINDKAYLPAIVKKIIARAKDERSAATSDLQTRPTNHD